jgi:quercetin dioxygenase-like cupin family protein
MKAKFFLPVIFAIFFSYCSTAQSNKPVKCTENSPERHGEEGCTILANRLLPEPLSKNVYWHLDRFDSLGAAMKAAGPNAVAAGAHGSFWLMTLEVKAEDHHGGHHVDWIGPLALPDSDRYTMRVLSSLLMPGSTTPVHTHSGPEVFYIVDGEQCLETPRSSQHLNSGQSYVVPGGSIHRGRVLGSKPRRAMALILYDAAYPPSHDLDNPPTLTSCK